MKKVAVFSPQHLIFFRTIFFFSVGITPTMEPNMGLELITLRSRPELRSRVGCLTYWATQAPTRCDSWHSELLAPAEMYVSLACAFCVPTMKLFLVCCSSSVISLSPLSELWSFSGVRKTQGQPCQALFAQTCPPPFSSTGSAPQWGCETLKDLTYPVGSYLWVAGIPSSTDPWTNLCSSSVAAQQTLPQT